MPKMPRFGSPHCSSFQGGLILSLQSEFEISPMEMYDIVLAEAMRLGHYTDFLKEFGTRTEFAKRLGIEETQPTQEA
jgi:hypothetical protein